jgi:hypothetical protein
MMNSATAKMESESNVALGFSATVCLPFNQAFTMIGKCREASTQNTSELRRLAPLGSALSFRLSSV